MNDVTAASQLETRRAIRAATELLAQWDDHIPVERDTLVTMLAAAYAQGAVDGLSFALGDESNG